MPAAQNPANTLPKKPAPNVPAGAKLIGTYDTSYKRNEADDNSDTHAALRALKEIESPIYVTVSPDDDDVLEFYARPGFVA